MKIKTNAMRKIAVIAAAMTMALSTMGTTFSAQTFENTTDSGNAVIEYSVESNTAKTVRSSSSNDELRELDFDNLKMGMSKNKVLKNCGISKFHETRKGSNYYRGYALISGKKFKVELAFNTNNELCTYAFYSKMDYSSFVDLFNSSVEEYGDDYGYIEDAGLYYWTLCDSFAGGIEYNAEKNECIAVFWDADYLDI